MYELPISYHTIIHLKANKDKNTVISTNKMYDYFHFNTLYHPPLFEKEGDIM